MHKMSKSRGRGKRYERLSQDCMVEMLSEYKLILFTALSY
jgi:hypothetical protein